MRVAAAVFRNQNKILLMRRGPDQPMAGQWEYPGGKFEPGEDGPQCVWRELFEELGINATIGNLITNVTYVTDHGKSIELYAYEILDYTGDISLCVHDLMEWVPIDELLNHAQLPADLLVSRVLVKNAG